MTTPFQQPALYVLRGGTLLKKDTTKSEPSSPKTIHYTHSIRMISGRSCQHEEQIKLLKERFQKEIDEKNLEIERFSSLLRQKQLQILSKDEEIGKLKVRESQNSLNKTWISSESQLPMIETIQQNNFHRRGHSDTLEIMLPDLSDSLTPQILKVKEQMKNTIETLNNISGNLRKPRRKYQFYNNFDRKPKESKETTIKKSYNGSETSVYGSSNELDSTFIEMVDETRIYELQPCKCRDSDLDQTFEEDSQDNVTFLQRIMRQHIKLKQTLIDLQQQTKAQLWQMKTYYQDQIQAYIQLLNKQGEKMNEFNLNSTRTNIDKDNEQVGSQSEVEENEEYFQWGKDHRFQIIFPEEDVLAPDIIE